MKKIILFIDQNSSLGGGQRVLIDLIQFCLNRGFNPSLMLPSEGYVSDFVSSLGIPFSTIPLPPMSAGKKTISEKISYPFYSLKCAEVIENFAYFKKVDLIFANGPRVFLPSVIAGKRVSKPVHLQLHLLFQSGVEKRLIAKLLQTDTVKSAVACSNIVFEPFKTIFPQKMSVIPYWVSPQFLTEKNHREELRKKYLLLANQIVIGVIGRISPTKGQLFFLKSILPFLEERKEVVILFGGSSDFENPEEEKKLKELAQNSSFKERIKILGMVEGLDFYDAIDILVVPSLWDEPFGLVAVEGMARSLPLVVTRSGALSETVLDGETGFVVEKKEDDLRKKIKLLVGSSELRKKMGTKGRERVEKYYNPEVQMEKILEKSVAAI